MKHEETSLMDTAVVTFGCGAELFLDALRQGDAFLQELALHVLEDDIALGRRRVETLITLLVVFFQKDYAVLAFGGVEVGLGTSLLRAKDKYLGALCLASFGGVAMDGDEEVGFGFVGDAGTFLKFNEDIRPARVLYGYFGMGFMNEFTCAKGNLEGDVLFVDLTVGTLGTGVLSTMPGINNDNELLRCRQADCHKKDSQQTAKTAGEESVEVQDT